MHSIQMNAFRDELTKIAAGKLVPALSIGGLAGLTGLEAAGALNKNKSGHDRMMSGAGATATGAILASELIHNKPWQWIKHAEVDSATMAALVEELSEIEKQAIANPFKAIANTAENAVSAVKGAFKPKMPAAQQWQQAHAARQAAGKAPRFPTASPGAAPGAPLVAGTVPGGIAKAAPQNVGGIALDTSSYRRKFASARLRGGR